MTETMRTGGDAPGLAGTRSRLRGAHKALARLPHLLADLLGRLNLFIRTKILLSLGFVLLQHGHDQCRAHAADAQLQPPV